MSQHADAILTAFLTVLARYIACLTPPSGAGIPDFGAIAFASNPSAPVKISKWPQMTLFKSILRALGLIKMALLEVFNVG